MKQLFLKALACQNSSGRPPIWLMRQAGRYMPAYRALRAKHSFLEMCHQPELAAQVTLLPIEAFDFDAAILFSDILVIPEAMQRGLHFEEDIGPIIDKPIKTEADLAEIPKSNMESLSYVDQAIKILKKELNVPLIGFCGAPFTVASYMIEGKSSKDLKMTKKWMLNHPELFHQLLKKIADWSIDYLNMQIAAGVNAVQIFDSWANVLSYRHFEEFSLYYLNYILKGIKTIPTILFCRGSSIFAPALAKISPTAIGLDWNCDIGQMRSAIPSNIALQGNLDPHILYAPLSVIEKETDRILDTMSADPGFIFNLGHGILPDVPEEAVRTLVGCVKRRSACHATLSS